MKQCPQCSSFECGPLVCRFTGKSHDQARDEANAYADAMIRKEALQIYATAETDIFGRPLKDGA